jgi:hypothetical protein
MQDDIMGAVLSLIMGSCKKSGGIILSLAMTPLNWEYNGNVTY